MTIYMYTHHAIHRPKTKNDNIVKVLMWALVLFFSLLFVLIAVVGFTYAHSAGPAGIMLGVALLLYAISAPIFKDTSYAYVEPQDQQILVVNYIFPFGIRRERIVEKRDIARAEISLYSKRYAPSVSKVIPYMILFFDPEGRFLFEVCYCQESIDCFQEYLKGQDLPPLS